MMYQLHFQDVAVELFVTFSVLSLIINELKPFSARIAAGLALKEIKELVDDLGIDHLLAQRLKAKQLEEE